MELKQYFVPFKLAVKLKKLGFDEHCLGLYNEDKTFHLTQCKSHEQFYQQICSAPLHEQVINWLATKHDIHFSIEPHNDGSYSIYSKNSECFGEYYIALNDAFSEAIKTLKKNNKLK